MTRTPLAMFILYRAAQKPDQSFSGWEYENAYTQQHLQRSKYQDVIATNEIYFLDSLQYHSCLIFSILSVVYYTKLNGPRVFLRHPIAGALTGDGALGLIQLA